MNWHEDTILVTVTVHDDSSLWLCTCNAAERSKAPPPFCIMTNQGRQLCAIRASELSWKQTINVVSNSRRWGLSRNRFIWH